VIPKPLPLLKTLSLNLQWKCYQGLPAVLIEPLQHQQNALVSNPASFVGTKKCWGE